MHILKIFKIVGRTFFPSFCVNCGGERVEGNKGSPEPWICDACQALLAPLPHTICPSCNARTIEGRLESACVQKTGLTRFFSGYLLQQKPLQALIYTYKYRHGSTLHGNLSQMLEGWLAANHLDELFKTTPHLIMIPIPLHKERLRERGFNQAEFFARDIANAFNLPYTSSCLVRVKQTPSQLIAHTKEAREKNMEGAFAVKNKEKIAGKRVVLIDDVYTTGATMKHAALALRQAGAAEVWGITVAKG